MNHSGRKYGKTAVESYLAKECKFFIKIENSDNYSKWLKTKKVRKYNSFHCISEKTVLKYEANK